jgi:glutamine synthetase
MGLTASFLPKPVVGVNGSGMHTNVSVSENGKNLFWDAKGEEKLSKTGWSFVDRILTHGNDLCLLLNASVNAYRRLDPHFEAPNQIKASAVDRGSMIRIPIGNEKSMRVEVRSVAPDANPYLVLYSIFKSGLEGETSRIKNLRQAERYLPDYKNSGRGCERAVRGFEAGGGRSVSAAAGNVCKSAGGAISPRRLQPIPVEFVLSRCSSAEQECPD